MVVADGQGLPLGESVCSASPHESTLAEKTVKNVFIPQGRKINRLIADRAYDCEKLRKRLMEMDIDLICPHRRNRKQPKLQDGRKLRRYRKRWKIERFFAWLGAYRRLVVRWDRDPEIYRAFFHVACIMILVRRL